MRPDDLPGVIATLVGQLIPARFEADQAGRLKSGQQPRGGIRVEAERAGKAVRRGRLLPPFTIVDVLERVLNGDAFALRAGRFVMFGCHGRFDMAKPLF
jgi:hypothetical protein